MVAEMDAAGLWGTDWTHAVNLLTFKQGVDASRATDRISAGDTAKLMGANTARFYVWSPRRA
jgi:hypothetical protein